MVLVALALLCGRAGAQREVFETTITADATVEAVLHSMVGRAGVIFFGTVVAVQRVPSGNGAVSGVVEVVFAVDHGLRGATTGGRYVLREWSGLWQGNDDRYQVGQRRLMLLHAPGPGGLSSPVGGMDGALPIRPGINASVEPLVDLRWIAARVSHGPVHYRAETPRIPRPRPMAEVLHSPGEVTPVLEAAPGSAITRERTSGTAEYASVSSITAAIARWQAEPR